MDAQNLNQVAGKPARGRPKGSGKGLSGSQRAINSRTARQVSGKKRIEVILSAEAFQALKVAKVNMKVAAYREVIEKMLLDNVRKRS